MALPELLANSPTPGSRVALASLGAAVINTTGTSITTNVAAPAGLQVAGQFRITIDSEIMLVTGGAATTTWTVVRGNNLAAPDTCTPATHSIGAPIYHYLTAGALEAAYGPAAISWTALPYALNWADAASPTWTGGQYSVPDGANFVRLRGLVGKSAAYSFGETIATLPAGNRPAANEMFACTANDVSNGDFFGSIEIAATGVISFGSFVPNYSTPGNVTLSLGGIAFVQGN